MLFFTCQMRLNLSHYIFARLYIITISVSCVVCVEHPFANYFIRYTICSGNASAPFANAQNAAMLCPKPIEQTRPRCENHAVRICFTKSTRNMDLVQEICSHSNSQSGRHSVAFLVPRQSQRWERAASGAVQLVCKHHQQDNKNTTGMIRGYSSSIRLAKSCFLYVLYIYIIYWLTSTQVFVCLNSHRHAFCLVFDIRVICIFIDCIWFSFVNNL